MNLIRNGEISEPGREPRRVEILPAHEPIRAPQPAAPQPVRTPERVPVPA